MAKEGLLRKVEDSGLEADVKAGATRLANAMFRAGYEYGRTAQLIGFQDGGLDWQDPEEAMRAIEAARERFAREHGIG